MEQGKDIEDGATYIFNEVQKSLVKLSFAHLAKTM
jgi:hypothetical protein